MMMKGTPKLVSLFITAIMLFASSALAQVKQNGSTYNENSVRPIRSDDHMFRKSLWFRVDLRAPTNAGFFTKNREITKLIIEGVRAGKITPYKSDELQEEMSLEDFNEMLRIPQASREDDIFGGAGDFYTEDWGDEEPKAQNDMAFAEGQYDYFPDQLYNLELKIDRIFDQRRSRMYNDIQALTVIIPAKMTPTNVDRVLASFSYKDLYNHLFHQKVEDRRVDNPDAVWYNAQNAAQSINLADAFDMGLYDGKLVKYENPKNNTIVDMYGEGKNSQLKSLEAVYKLMEYEALLWSY